MGESSTGAWKGGGICADVGNVLHHGCSGGSPLQFGFVVHVLANWEGAGNISPSGDTEADGADDRVERGRHLNITFPGGGNGGEKNAKDRILHHPSPKDRQKIWQQG